MGESFWVHPIVIATYATALPILFGAFFQLFRLFYRVRNVEESTARLEAGLEKLSEDLRQHMDEEERSARLLQLTMSQVDEKLNALTRPSYRE